MLLLSILAVDPSNEATYMVEDQQEKADVNIISAVSGKVYIIYYQIVFFAVTLI